VKNGVNSVMSRIKSKNTKPEITVRKHLFSKGFRYRIHYSKLPGNPDIALPRYKTAIMVNGCFWHAHKNCKLNRLPKKNLEYWEPKIRKNVERDGRIKNEIEKSGWNLIVVWECELKTNTSQQTLEKIVSSLQLRVL
jgi:DNA mismatch endonuclease, patch repair protein